MMVDPMVMIVQNLKLFLTAVTPTAVPPTVDQIGPYWTILNNKEPYWTIWTSLNQFEPV